ncbi:hypothetical protein PRIPAC_85961 [Pristionchus pacificus]|uniref:Uncharacterized protein n=1 Tax=Pristionchus pacificus TaxID=54126 RepID=A0A2A6BDC7_PRIPA|nr:hypothetical protein PRIPAC_85961 [Pristionchus pacificus]|eukprot:PDM63887.1 hypothetical protein PRIPAC_53670 [Pristionchus pacificus]
MVEYVILQVEVVAKNVSATQHSYTVLPIIKADGTLGEQLYVVLQEPGGRFPQKGHVKLDNLIVRAASTHIMTKSLMLDWFKECVAHPFSPTGARGLLVQLQRPSSQLYPRERNKRFGFGFERFGAYFPANARVSLEKSRIHIFRYSQFQDSRPDLLSSWDRFNHLSHFLLC